MNYIISISTVPTNEDMLSNTLKSLFATVEGEYVLMVERNDWQSFSAAHNRALKLCALDERYTGVFVCNDDITFNKGWLETYRKYFAQDTVVGHFPRGGGFFPEYEKMSYVGFDVVWIPREVILRIGYLDEQFKIGECEDIDYCWRALDANCKLAALEEEDRGVFDHIGSQTLNKKRKEIDFGNINRDLFRNKIKGTRWEGKF